MSDTKAPDTGQLQFEIVGGGELTLTEFRGFIAGYTGRDRAAVEHHIAELAEIGVAPPPEIPMFYEMPTGLFTVDSAMETTGGTLTSGEVEPLYIRAQGAYFLGLGSDHTDRDLEAVDIADSKRACPKPVGRLVRRVPELDTLSLDDVMARCVVDEREYQRGTLDAILRPADTIGMLLSRIDVGDSDFVCLGGTIPLLAGGFTRGDEWGVSLAFPDGSILEHEYRVKERQP